jgi:hypothetical protein
LSQAFLSPLASSPDDLDSCIELVHRGLIAAAQRRIEILTVGFAAGDPRLTALGKRFRCREYRTRLYRVRWTEVEDALGPLADRLICPEISLL